jgi:hypothetical protein
MNLPVAVYNVDATKRHRTLNTQDALIAHLAGSPLATPVAAYTEVSSKFFAERLAAARDAHYVDHAFGRAAVTAAEDATPPATPERPPAPDLCLIR